MNVEIRRALSTVTVRLADVDRAAFDGVYSVLWPAVTTFCAKTLSKTDAEDQHALLKVLAKRRRGLSSTSNENVNRPLESAAERAIMLDIGRCEGRMVRELP